MVNWKENWVKEFYWMGNKVIFLLVYKENYDKNFFLLDIII